MIRRLALLVILTLSGAAPRIISAQRPALGDRTIARIDSAVARFMTTNRVPGAAIAVVDHGAYACS